MQKKIHKILVVITLQDQVVPDPKGMAPPCQYVQAARAVLRDLDLGKRRLEGDIIETGLELPDAGCGIAPKSRYRGYHYAAEIDKIGKDFIRELR